MHYLVNYNIIFLSNINFGVKTMENSRPNWTSRYAFILASIGSAVGLGNIWRFPYIMGQYGGAIFLITYLLLITTICFIPLLTELAVGKITQKECIGAYESINPKFKLLGVLNPITGILVASFYFVVGGWIINYIYLAIINSKINDHALYFSTFIKEPIVTCILTLSFLFMCIFFTARGVKKGIEVANKILMPIFAVILVCLIICALNLPNAHLGLEYMFKPDLSKISGEMFLCALGQALFTLSIGMGTLLTYGSYIKDDKNIAKSAYTIIFFDTMFALMAGTMIFPAIFAFNLEPNSGAGLVFETLPYIFAQIPYGNIVSIAFFVLLLFAALTSGISILEVPVASLIERQKISRVKACSIIFVIIAIISILATLSFGILSNFLIIDKSIFDFLDYITANLLMPLNALCLCLIAGWALKIKGNMFIKNNLFAKLFDLVLRFVIPLTLIFLLYIGLK